MGNIVGDWRLELSSPFYGFLSAVQSGISDGIFRPVILMPKNTDWENGRQLQYVLAHELVHIRCFDGALKLIMVLALCIHWFNPLVWIMYMLFNRDIELSCDESVIRLFGENARSSYAFTLINMEEKKSGILPLCNNFSRNAIEERIVSIMKTKRVTVGAVFAGILIIVGMAAAFTTSVRKDNAKMVFMQKKVYIATGEDVSAQVEAEAGISEFDSPYIGEIMSTVAASKQPGEELQSNFGHVGAQIV